MKQPDPYYFEAIKMTSQAQSMSTSLVNVRLPLIFSIQNLIENAQNTIAGPS